MIQRPSGGILPKSAAGPLAPKSEARNAADSRRTSKRSDNTDHSIQFMTTLSADLAQPSGVLPSPFRTFTARTRDPTCALSLRAGLRRCWEHRAGGRSKRSASNRRNPSQTPRSRTDFAIRRVPGPRKSIGLKSLRRGVWIRFAENGCRGPGIRKSGRGNSQSGHGRHTKQALTMQAR